MWSAEGPPSNVSTHGASRTSGPARWRGAARQAHSFRDGRGYARHLRRRRRMSSSETSAYGAGQRFGGARRDGDHPAPAPRGAGVGKVLSSGFKEWRSRLRQEGRLRPTAARCSPPGDATGATRRARPHAGDRVEGAWARTAADRLHVARDGTPKISSTTSAQSTETRSPAGEGSTTTLLDGRAADPYVRAGRERAWGAGRRARRGLARRAADAASLRPPLRLVARRAWIAYDAAGGGSS